MSTNEKISVLIDEKTIDKRLDEMAQAINRDYKGKEISLVSVLKGGVYITTELSKKITVPVTLDFMSVSSYGSGTVSSGEVIIKKDLDESIEGKDVLVVEDIIDTGYTLACLMELLKERKPASLKLCTLLDKPGRRKAQVNVDYKGFIVPDKFIIGYGLDYDQKYRNLPFVGVLDFMEEEEK